MNLYRINPKYTLILKKNYQLIVTANNKFKTYQVEAK